MSHRLLMFLLYFLTLSFPELRQFISFQSVGMGMDCKYMYLLKMNSDEFLISYAYWPSSLIVSKVNGECTTLFDDMYLKIVLLYGGFLHGSMKFTKIRFPMLACKELADRTYIVRRRFKHWRECGLGEFTVVLFVRRIKTVGVVSGRHSIWQIAWE